MPSNTLQWRHDGRDSVSNHQSHDCLLNRLFTRSSKKTSKLRVTGFCVGNSPVTGEFPAQMASNAENVSIRDVIMISRCFNDYGKNYAHCPTECVKNCHSLAITYCRGFGKASEKPLGQGVTGQSITMITSSNGNIFRIALPTAKSKLRLPTFPSYLSSNLFCQLTICTYLPLCFA